MHKNSQGLSCLYPWPRVFQLLSTKIYNKSIRAGTDIVTSYAKYTKRLNSVFQDIKPQLPCKSLSHKMLPDISHPVYREIGCSFNATMNLVFTLVDTPGCLIHVETLKNFRIFPTFWALLTRTPAASGQRRRLPPVFFLCRRPRRGPFIKQSRVTSERI